MKKGLLLLVLFLGISLCLVAQSVPQGMNYQAVARDMDGRVLADEQISLKISLLGENPDGKVMYSEIHEVTTSSLGLFNVVIGQGAAGLGDFAEISWGSVEVWMEMSLELQDEYIPIATTRLLTIPYAFHAGTAGELTGSNGTEKAGAKKEWETDGNADIDPTIHKLGTTDSAPLIVVTDDTERMRVTESGMVQMSGNNIKNLADPVDAQDAATKGYVDGIQVSLEAHLAADDDLSPTNELNTGANLSGSTLMITDGGGGAVVVELSSLEESAEIAAAQTSADGAQATADQATTDAAAAQTSAAGAQTTADQATTEAAAAQTSAVAAQGTADQATTEAAAAQTAAEGAQTPADQATTAAAAAQTSADGAQATADQATTDAAAAQTSADAAQATADQATTAAAAAQTSADAAQDNIDSHVYLDWDTDPNNEIELPTGGTPGQVLSADGFGNYIWVALDSGPQGIQGPQGLSGADGVDGTFPAGVQAGQMNYWNGNSWVRVAPGTTGEELSFCDGVPTWGPCPSCNDGIQNQGETRVDCGGPNCAACPPTCSDGIQNQGEIRVDCGGPNCTPCPTCYDGIQNQGETGVDCGPICGSLCIGASYAGGIIFYLDATGQHGLVAAPADLARTQWGCVGLLIGGTSSERGSGQANTTAIVNGCGQAGIAARLCDEYEPFYGSDDWFLPSKDELNLMYLNLKLHQPPLGSFGNTRYWSSTEQSSNFAWFQDFYTGQQVGTTSKGFANEQKANVRPVRAF